MHKKTYPNQKKNGVLTNESSQLMGGDSLESSATAPSVTIGKYLKSKREQRDISIKVLSQHTKISLTMLSCLEEENYDKLPDLTYVRGFVKNYMKALGAAPDEALTILEQTYYFNKKERDQTAETLQAPSPIVSSKNKKIINVMIPFFIIAILAMVVFRNSSKDQAKIEELAKTQASSHSKNQMIESDKIIKPTTLSAKTPLKKNSDKAIFSEPQIKKELTEVNQQPAQKENLKIAATVAPSIIQGPSPTKPLSFAIDKEKPTVIKAIKIIDQQKKVAEKVKVTNQQEEINIKNTKNIENETKPKKEIEFKTLTRQLYSISENSKDSLIKFVPENYRQSIVSGKQNLFIRADGGETWITFKIDGNPIKKFILKDGRHLLIRGDEITAFLGNVHVTKIFLNNQLLKIKSNSGVKSLIFPQERRDKHKYPLFIYNDDGSVTSSHDYIQAKKSQVEN